MARWTEPRRTGLVVLWAADQAGRETTISNQTSSPGAERPTVYWQVANWLRDQGIATCGLQGPITLTDHGRRLAAEGLDGAPA